MDARCPGCGSLVRHDALWCTLCHADLRPAEPVTAEPVTAEPAAVAAAAGGAVVGGAVVGGVAGQPTAAPVDPLTAPIEQVLAELSLPPSETVGAPDAVPAPAAAVGPPEVAAEVVDQVVTEVVDDGASATVEGLDAIEDADVLFAMLRAQSEDPLLAKVGGRLDTKGSQFLVMVVGASVVSLVLFVGLAVLGAVFT